MRDAICVWGDTGSVGGPVGFGELGAIEALRLRWGLRWGLGGGACERHGVGVGLVAADDDSGAGFSAGSGAGFSVGSGVGFSAGGGSR